MKRKLSDMQIFINVFGFKHKVINASRTVFKVFDVDAQKQLAQNIIDSNKLDLKIVSTGEMASYKSFEVWEG